MIIRPLESADLAELGKIYYRAVHEGAAAHYSDAERAAWAPAPLGPAVLATRLADQTCFVAEEDGGLLGFMTLTPTGHIDFAFVCPDQRGLGVADRLYDSLVESARVQGLKRLTTDASYPARSFFLRHGWHVTRVQHPVRAGVTLTNFAMEIALA